MAADVRFWVAGFLLLAVLEGCAVESVPVQPWRDIGGSCPELTATAFAAVKDSTLVADSVGDHNVYYARCEYGRPDAPTSFVAEYFIDRSGRRSSHDAPNRREAEIMVNRGPEEDGFEGAVELPRVGVPAVAYLEEKITARAWSENAIVGVGFANLPSEMETLTSRSDDMTALLKDLLTGLRRQHPAPSGP